MTDAKEDCHVVNKINGVVSIIRGYWDNDNNNINNNNNNNIYIIYILKRYSKRALFVALYKTNV